MSVRRWIIFWSISLTLLLTGCQGAAPDTNSQSATSPTPVPRSDALAGPRIMFFSDREEADGIFTMNPDGSDVRKLEFPQLKGYKTGGLTWIPELGLFLASLSDVYNQADYFLMDADGNILQRLTEDIYGEGEGTYSAQAGRFAFVCVINDLDICTIQPDGVNLINLSSSPSRENEPHWSADGSQVLFSSNRSGVPAIWIVDQDGANMTRLSDVEAPEGHPRWSPDGKQILFQSSRDRNWEIYLMDPDGSNARNLTNHEADDTEADWSPDGKYIAFKSERDGGIDLFVMQADGSGVVNITGTPDEKETNFLWTFDSQKVIYDSRSGDVYDIYSVNVDGSGRTNLTNRPGVDFDPLWVGN